MALMGAGQVVASLVVCAVALTRVVMPYDELFVGMSRAELMAVNDRLLPFMTHDRISFGITTLSLGILYVCLAVFGHGAGHAWARRTLIASAVPGFLGFFLFLGFGYFDPLHFLVWGTLLGLFLLGLRRPHPSRPVDRTPDPERDRAWRLARIGQWSYIVIGIGLAGAGLIIAIIGSTRVFVPTDLEFMGTTAQALRDANPQILPLVAHDRAGFGGALLALGIGVSVTSWWGIRRGARWVWWALTVSGSLGFLGAIGIHLAVGYTSFEHMAPAYLALVTFAFAAVLTRRFLFDRAPAPSGA